MTCEIVDVLLISAAGLAIGLWQVFALRAAYHGSAIRQLKSVDATPPRGFPKLSVIVTARNEERMMEQDLASLIEVTYPDIEFIVVDDRSTDHTGVIIDEFARRDGRIKPIHINELPDGWLGKVNALHVATKEANGEWLLFTDADIRFERDVLERAVALCESEGLDHLAMLPSDRSQAKGLLVPIVVLAFGAMFLTRTKARLIGKRGSSAFVGVGAFNLVRRSAFERTAGFESLKMEVVDDVGLGFILKQSGATSALLGAEGLLSFEWYHSLGEAIRGLEKNAFAGFARYSYLRGIALVLWMWVVVLLPIFVSIICGTWVLLTVYVLFDYLIPAVVAHSMRRTLQTKPVFVGLMPIGYFFVSIALLNSIYQTWRYGGIKWRETFYPIDALRAGKRVSI